MENQAPVQASKLKPLLLGFAVLLVFLGGGFAIWSAMKKEEEPETIEEPIEKSTTEVTGRINATNLYTADELEHSALINSDLPNNTPNYEAVLIASEEGKDLIEARMETIQLNHYDADKIRARYLVGKNLDHIQSLSSKANELVEKMFGLVDGTTEGDYLTYPVYGKYEPQGEALRKDINNFLAKDGQGYNLSEKRHGGNDWWFGSVGLNLMYGNSNATLHTADQIWWHKASRSGLDFFKKINGHDVPDHDLLKKINGKGVFAAWGMVGLVKEWKVAMDTFDTVTRQEAISALEREGLIKRF
ncbi:MAG: hypothetical protein JKY03_13910 [Aureispira sp.]|nr:hypothetical protein [Aureispira sp.]